MRRRLPALLLVIAAAAAVVALYYALAPESGLYPRCMFKQLTGLDCPGCGSQRAIHAMLHGRWADAWHYNALLLVELPLIALLIAVRSARRRCPRLYMLLNSRTVILIILATTLLWTIIRNIPLSGRL